MPTNQEARQASVRAVTGTTLDYNGDWHALFDVAAIPKGTYNERLLQWINQKLVASYTSLSSALQALATTNGAYNFSSMGTFDAGGGGGALAGDITAMEVLGPSAFVGKTAPIPNVDPNAWVLKVTIKGTTIGQTLTVSKCSIIFGSVGYDSAGNATAPTFTVGVIKQFRIPIAPSWTTTEVVPAGTRRLSISSGISRSYITVAGGTCGATAPTGTGTNINDGGVLWNYLSAESDITPVFEEQVGPDAVVYLVLSDYVFLGDTFQAVNFQAGWYGTANASNSAFFTPVNSSSVPQIMPTVVELNQAYDIVGSTMRVEFAVHHPFGQQNRTVAAFQYNIEDGSGNVLQQRTLTSMVRSTLATGGNKVMVFGETLTFSGVSDGQIYIRYKAFPFRGAAFDSVNQGYATAFPVAASATPVNNSIRIPIWKDAAGVYGRVFVHVDPVSGNNTTGQASTVEATSAALPFLTIDAAYSTATRGAIAVNNTTFARNNISNVHCLLKAGTYADGYGGANMNGRPRGDVISVIRRDPNSTSGPNDVIFQSSTTLNNKRGLTRCRIESIRVEMTNSTAPLDNQVTSTGGDMTFETWFEGCNFVSAITQRVLFRFGLSWLKNCSFTTCSGAFGLDGRSNIKLALGCQVIGNNAGGASNTSTTLGAVNALGNVFTASSTPSTVNNTFGWDGTGSVVPVQTAMWAFNSWPKCNVTPKQYNGAQPARQAVWSCNYVEIYDIVGGAPSAGVASAKSGELSGDLVVLPVNWLFHDWNMYPGEGINLCYNENGLTAGANVFKRCLDQYNVAGDHNVKSDYYDTPPQDSSQYRVGNMAFHCGVGCHYNFIYAPTDISQHPSNVTWESWPGDNRLLAARGNVTGRGLGTGEDPKFTNDQSFYAPSGSSAGNGDYTGTSTSPHRGMGGSNRGFYPEDLNGVTRKSDDVVGAFTWA